MDNIHSSIIGNSNINNNTILLKYLFCIQNYRQIYERKYNDIFEAFSSIGGIIQFFYYAFYLINYFYNDFILILNTQNLFLIEPKNKKITKLIPFSKYPMRLESKINNNTLLKNYESSNYIQELQYYKLFSKDNKNNLNIFDGDVSSIQLSESNNDKDSRFMFNKKKDDNTVKINYIKKRRSQQLNYNNLIKFRLKDDLKKKACYRNSMFNPKNTAIFSPFQKVVEKNNNLLNLISSNRECSNNEENKIFETFNNNINNNNNYSRNITFIDNRYRNYNNNSFAENVKMSHFLKNKRQTLKMIIVLLKKIQKKN